MKAARLECLNGGEKIKQKILNKKITCNAVNRYVNNFVFTSPSF